MLKSGERENRDTEGTGRGRIGNIHPATNIKINRENGDTEHRPTLCFVVPYNPEALPKKRDDIMALTIDTATVSTSASQADLDKAQVELKPLHRENLYKHFQWNNDPELNHLDSEIPYRRETLGTFKRRFEQMIYQPAPDSCDFEIYADDGTVIGVAYVVNISTYNRHCTLGITIGDRDYWGKGYGRAALRTLLRYCFDELNMHRVSAESFEYNEAWRKLIVWAGFKKEGTGRDYLFREGRFWDKNIYAILEAEYRSRVAIAA